MAYDSLSPSQGHQALSDIDVIRGNLNELRAFEASASTSPPTNPTAGQFWWNTDTQKLYQRNQANTTWIYLWGEATGELPVNEGDFLNHTGANITSLVTVHGIRQGSGNGFDADKLDNVEGAAYLQSAAHNVSSNVHGQPAAYVLLSAPTSTPFLVIAGSAPLGWTQVPTWNDRVIRVVSGAGGGQGGGWPITGLSGEFSHTHTQPTHTHNQNMGATNTDSASFGRVIAAASSFNSDVSSYSAGGASITQMRTGVQAAGGETVSAGSVHFHSGNGAWRPAYTDVIAVTKNA